MDTVPRRTGDGSPVRRPVAMPVPGFGGSGLYCGHAPSYHRYVGTVFMGAALAGFWEPTFFMAGFRESAFFMAGFWESVLLGPASWSRLSRNFLGGRLLRLGRLLGVGPGDSRPREGGPMLCVLEGLNGLIIFQRARGSRLGYPWPFTPTKSVMIIIIRTLSHVRLSK